MNNYICTGKGFVMGKRFDPNAFYKTEILFTDKVRKAQTFNTKGALKFMDTHGLEGFVWKPNEQEPVRNSYTVRKRSNNVFEDDDDALEWIPEKLIMTSDSDVGFLMSGKLKAEDAMTFDEAKAEALRRNTEMVSELMEKIDKLKTKREAI